MASKNSPKILSDKNKTIITLMFLLATFVLPVSGIIGVILMWIWMKWRLWIKILVTLPFLIFLFSALFVLGYLFVSRPVKIVGSSMEPNFIEGQYYMTNVLNEQKQLSRGDVVIFIPPDVKREAYKINIDDSNENIKFIERIIALPNERVMIQNNSVYINDQKLDESSYLNNTTTIVSQKSKMIEGEEIMVPSDQYFVLGDNREKSQDSRYFGTVPLQNIVSKIGFCYWKCLK